MIGRRCTAVAAVLVLVGTTGHSCGAERRALPDRTPPATAPATIEPRLLVGVPMTGPTGIRLLTQGRLLDVDARTNASSPFDSWLSVPGRAPLLVAGTPTTGKYGQARVSPMPAGPGGLRAIRLYSPPTATAAASRDGRGVWLLERADADHCSLREVGLDGSVLRPARPFECGRFPIGETPAGLWTGNDLPGDDALLLDPDTLAVRARYPAVALIDEYQVMVFSTMERDGAMELRDMRTGLARPVPRPPAYGWPGPQIEGLSPDGRWLPFVFGQPSSSPQVMDLWLLDLRTTSWVHLPSMPAFTELKATALDWAADGRLVLLGSFTDVVGSDDAVGLLVTWRPGEDRLAVRAYARPPVGPGAYTPAILIA